MHGRADGRASLGLWHWGGSSKSPVSTGTAPALLSSMANPGRAVVSARGSCIAPFHLALPAQALTEIRSHPGGRSRGQVCSATGSKPSWFSSITPGSTSHLPTGFLGASPQLPPSSPQPPGCSRHLVQGRQNSGSAVGRGWLRRPWFSLQPCAVPAAPSQHQARGKVFLAFSFPN